ncbi:hypothetical protein AOPFMNJM_1361 [Methylobacterium jeotgali]|uniref:Uncharacterized protein n=2 Tax=Methylobacteriaceae TaxID=119045 RepID=A0ABQ4SUA3_9HYPH|nr:hypothetical protein AwMethylo_06610 [Methylobacterium sp.]GJE06055.1 hypothetical protein AOPFMNJM_1361 [Methylobacterium jeotgali]
MTLPSPAPIRPFSSVGALLALALFPALAGPSLAAEGMKQTEAAPAAATGRVRDVPAVEAVDPATLKPGAIVFTDYRDKPENPESGLTPFKDWARLRPAEAAALTPFAGYKEPDYTTTVNGVSKPRHEALKVYVAKARFVVARPAEGIDLNAFANLAFVQAMDPAIKHRVLNPAEVTPTKDPAAAFARRPDRPWCAEGLCIESRYDLEGKLPLGVRLANKLEEGDRKKIAEFVSFQSELRVLPPAEAAGLSEFTGVATPVTGALRQTIFWVNQILRFGTFLAVVQPVPGDPQRAVVSVSMALAVKADVLDRKAEYARVPVLKNLLPAQVLMGNSSFNTGSSISAGLPTYARNRVAAFADALARR